MRVFMRVQAGRGEQARRQCDEGGDHVAQQVHRPHRDADVARRQQVVAHVVDVAAPFGEAQEEIGEEAGAAEDEDLRRNAEKAASRPVARANCPAGTGTASWVMRRERTKPKTKEPVASVAKIAGTSA